MKHRCGNTLLLTVKMENMFSAYGNKLNADSVAIHPTELVPNGLTLEYGELYCPYCKVEVRNLEEEVLLSCSECSRVGEKQLMSILSVVNYKHVRPVILHDNCVESFKMYIKKSVVGEPPEFKIVKNFKVEIKR